MGKFDRRVYVIYTGGTIGMLPQHNGMAPAPGYLVDQMASMPEMSSDLMPQYDIHEYQPLLDSSNMLPADWMKIGKDIVDYYHQYDGFVMSMAPTRWRTPPRR